MLKTVIAVAWAVPSTSSPALKWKWPPCKIPHLKTTDASRFGYILCIWLTLKWRQLFFILRWASILCSAFVLLSPGVSALHQSTPQIRSCRTGTGQDTAQTLFHGVASMFRWDQHNVISSATRGNHAHTKMCRMCWTNRHRQPALYMHCCTHTNSLIHTDEGQTHQH